MVEKSSVDVIALSADKVMDVTKGLLPRLSPSHRLKSLRALLRLRTQAKRPYMCTIERLTKEVRKLGVGRSQPPRRRYKGRSPSSHHHRRHSNKPRLSFYHSRFGMEAGRAEHGTLFTRFTEQTCLFYYRLQIPSTQEQLAVFGHWNSSQFQWPNTASCSCVNQTTCLGSGVCNKIGTVVL